MALLPLTGMTNDPYHHPTSKVARNCKIVEAAESGVSQAELARQYKLSKGRVWQIIQKAKRDEASRSRFTSTLAASP